MKDSAEILSHERSTPDRPRDTASSSLSSDGGAPPQAEGTETPRKPQAIRAFNAKPNEWVYFADDVDAYVAALRGTEAATTAPLEKE